MSRAEKLVTLYNPDHGTEVEVNEERAEVLKGRGYTTSKPRIRRGTKTGAKADDGNVELQAELERLRAENEALKNPAPK